MSKSVGTGNSNMKYYYIPTSWAHKIPIELYKNNVLILTWRPNCDSMTFDIGFDISFYFASMSDGGGLLYLQNLNTEDFIHLNLLGIPIRQQAAQIIPELSRALNNQQDMFTVSGDWTMDF